MLIKVKVENTRSIKCAEVSFLKSGISFRNGYVFNKKYVNPLTIYGDNGSGKSVFLESLKYLAVLMNYDEKELSQCDIIFDIVAVLSDKKSKEAPYPKLSFLFKTKDNITFEYIVSCFADSIRYEKLIVEDKIVLKRNKKNYEILESGIKEEIGESYSAIRKIGIEEYNEQSEIKTLIKKCYECMKKVIFVDCHERVFGSKFVGTTPRDIMLGSSGLADLVSSFSSLPKFKYVEDNVLGGKKTILLDFGNGRRLPLSLLSDGIARENHLLSALYTGLSDSDSVIVIDEISRSIHPLNLKGIIKLFVDKNIQMLFSCHDTSIMKDLRPDQIYFAYFKESLETVFYRLNELHPNIREINNIESMYLKGIFDEELQRKNS